jgi:hypothetical protein
MEQQKAHWYSIILTAIPDDLDDCHHAAFPSLSRLSNIDEDIICEVLRQAGLVRYTSNYGYSVMPLAWTEFIREYNLEEEVEVTHFFIRRRKRIYIRIGSWHATSHPRKTPSAIWSLGVQGSLRVPRLRITALGNDFAKRIGEMGLTFGSTRCISSSISSDSDCSESECSHSKCSEKAVDIAENSVISLEREECHNEKTLPDPVDFPLLHVLFSNQPGNIRVMNQLLIELKKVTGAIQSSICEVTIQRGCF